MQFFCRLTRFYSVGVFFADGPGRNWPCLGEAVSSRIKSRPCLDRNYEGHSFLAEKRWISEVWRTVREASSLTANHCHSPPEKTKSRKEGRERRRRKKKETYCRRWREILIIYLRGTRSDARPLVVAFEPPSLFPIFPRPLRPLAFEKIRQRGATRLSFWLQLLLAISLRDSSATVNLKRVFYCRADECIKRSHA